MYSEVSQRVRSLVEHADNDIFSKRRVGLEKETLRIDEGGRIAQTGHPASLGSALCNGRITTDFSEALLEMVTPPCDSAESALEYIKSIHQFILPRLENSEGLWNTSMPCVIDGDDSIRVGLYGDSHNGVMKHVYRRGLGLRYGKRMQAIAGIHFNFSLPEESWAQWQQLHGVTEGNHYPTSTDGYFHMTRNLMRVGWLVPYLFGASPAICQTFLPSGFDSNLETLNKTTRFARFGTSLRMGEIGYRYREDSPIDLSVRHDTFDNYLSDILAHVTSPHPAYQEMGLKDANGQFHQLNANRLQIENEYYSSVRPKQIPEQGELPILALQRKGIQYLELRSVDVNVYDPVGMHLEQLAMLELLMLFAWVSDSPPLTAAEMELNKQNISRVANRGREPGLQLKTPGGSVSLAEWGARIASELAPLAQWLDGGAEQTGEQANLYSRSLQQQFEKLNDASLTPSARIVDELSSHGSFFKMVMELSSQHAKTLSALPVTSETITELTRSVPESIAAQKSLEDSTTGSFDDFIASYFKQLESHAAQAV